MRRPAVCFEVYIGSPWSTQLGAPVGRRSPCLHPLEVTPTAVFENMHTSSVAFCYLPTHVLVEEQSFAGAAVYCHDPSTAACPPPPPPAISASDPPPMLGGATIPSSSSSMPPRPNPPPERRKHQRARGVGATAMDTVRPLFQALISVLAGTLLSTYRRLSRTRTQLILSKGRSAAPEQAPMRSSGPLHHPRGHTHRPQ